MLDKQSDCVNKAYSLVECAVHYTVGLPVIPHSGDYMTHSQACTVHLLFFYIFERYSLKVSSVISVKFQFQFSNG